MIMANLVRNQNRRNYPKLFWRSPMDRFFRNDWMDLWGDDELQTIPSVNVTETDQHFMIELAAPGLKKEDFNIEVEGNVLMISSEKESEKKEGEEKENKFFRREYSYSSFSRSFTLPDNADGDKISAKYEDGLLKLTIQKKPEEKAKNGYKVKIE
jgi:HSP20 family protein